MRVGIVAAEFLEPGATRIGGFGWGARRAATVLRDAGEHPVFVCPDVEALEATPDAFDGVPLVANHDGAVRFVRELRRVQPDVLLSVDYRPSYDTAFKALPRTPVVVWVRDPRPPEDVATVAGIRDPEAPEEVPQGLGAIDCTGIARIVRWSALIRRRISFASPAPDALAPKARGTYGHDPGGLALLPNPIDVRREPGPKATRPRVAWLGRLDPVKRPWLFVELARSFPDVDFVMLGRSHFDGPGSWRPHGLPPNVALRGNLSGTDKHRELDAAWVLVNTSVHEALAVSLQEALAARTPLLSCVDTEGIASRFGIFAGRHPGDGMAALPGLRAGMTRLLADGALRERLGAAGRAWVSGRHTPSHFLEAFRVLVAPPP